jgi:DNA polymerase III delta prime subunit
MRRPNPEQVVTHLAGIAGDLQLKITDKQLYRIANNYGCDMRKCVELAHSAVEQVDGHLVSDDYLDAIFGVQPEEATAQVGAAIRPRL